MNRMQVVVNIPDAVAKQLAEEQQDPARALIEGLAVDGYRSGRLSRGQVAEMLGLSFHQAEKWFVEKKLPRNYGMQEFEQDLQTIDELFGRK